MRSPYNFRFPPELIARVDAVSAAQGQSRTAFIEGAIEAQLAAGQVMGLFTCPVCEFTSDSKSAVCAAHGRKVVPAGQLV